MVDRRAEPRPETPPSGPRYAWLRRGSAAWTYVRVLGDAGGGLVRVSLLGVATDVRRRDLRQYEAGCMDLLRSLALELRRRRRRTRTQSDQKR